MKKVDMQELVSKKQIDMEKLVAGRLEEIDARERAAEKGPWKYDDLGQMIFFLDGGSMVAELRGWGRMTGNPGHMSPDAAAAQQEANGQFLAHSREDIPWLRNLVRELQACNARQVQLLKDAQLGWAADVARLTFDREEALKRAEAAELKLGPHQTNGYTAEDREADEECR